MTETLLDVRKKARRTFAVLCLWIPLAVFIAIAIVQLAVMPWLPDPVATHWGISGAADGFGAAWTYPAMAVGIGGGVTALIAGMALFEVKSNTQRTQYRFLGAVIGAELGFLGTMMLGLVLTQIGLDDATDAPNSLWVMGIGAALAAVLGVIYYLVLEEPPAEEDARAEVKPLEMAATEHAVWTRAVSMSRVGAITLSVLLAATFVAVLAVSFAVMRDEGYLPVSLWLTLIVVVLMPLVILSSMRFTVTITDDGLLARSVIGWPKILVKTADMTSAKLVEVSPMAEFGGWGWRFGANGQGIVLRAGEGIRIGRAGKGDLTITVDDAETAVALLRRTMERAG